MGDASTAGDRPDSATGGAKAAASRATEDKPHAYTRALKTAEPVSSMSVRLERLEALLSA